MRAPRIRAAVFVLGLTAALGVAASAAADVRPRTGWLQLQSPNFLLFGDVSARELRQVAERLEQFRETLGILLPKATISTATPTTVVVFKSHKSYEPLKPLYQGKVRSNTAGFFLAGQAVNYVTLTLEGGLDNLGIIYHEYVHLLVNNNVGGIPVWFNEGLAEYYRTFQVNDAGDRAFIGRFLEDHILLLREQFIPLQALASVDHQSPLYNESNKASVFYAESWALVHYLIMGEEQKYAKQAAAFAFALGNGQALDAAARSTLGISAADLEKGLRRYVGRDLFQSQRITFSSDRIAKLEAVPAAPTAETDVHALLGDVLMQMDRRDDAKAELAAAMALDSGHGAAHATLGMLDVREGDWEASRRHFQQAVASPSATFLSHYYYGVALSQGLLAQAPAADDLATMERSFRRAIELNPTFADSYAQLAHVVSRDEKRTNEAAELMIKALKLMPGREDYVLAMATLLSNAQDFAAAKPILNALATRANDQNIRNLARARLDQILDYEKRRAEWEAGSKSAASPPSTSPERVAPGGTRTMLKLRDVKAGESRYAGQLTSIECSDKGIVLVVKVDNGVLRARAPKFDAVDFVTYREDIQGRVECGPRQTPARVLLTLQLDAGTQESGTAVVVEFVPDEYEAYDERRIR
jgi:tetratricopeptide (TPR) repeat protein